MQSQAIVYVCVFFPWHLKMITIIRFIWSKLVAKSTKTNATTNSFTCTHLNMPYCKWAKCLHLVKLHHNPLWIMESDIKNLAKNKKRRHSETLLSLCKQWMDCEGIRSLCYYLLRKNPKKILVLMQAQLDIKLCLTAQHVTFSLHKCSSLIWLRVFKKEQQKMPKNVVA